jgi:5-methylcytosine-specific restriction endonuclease McrA
MFLRSFSIRRTASSNSVVPRAKATAKKTIPKSLRNSVWETYIGRKFEGKCHVDWCTNVITPFTFEVGHNIPESKGGETTLDNLRPICTQCNKSMGNKYTIEQFSKLYNKQATDTTEEEIMGHPGRGWFCCS